MKQTKYWTLLSHLNVVLSIMFLTFFVIDRINPAMNFLGSEISEWLLCVFAVCAFAQAVIAIVHIRILVRKKNNMIAERESRRKEYEQTNDDWDKSAVYASNVPASSIRTRRAPNISAEENEMSDMVNEPTFVENTVESKRYSVILKNDSSKDTVLNTNKEKFQ